MSSVIIADPTPQNSELIVGITAPIGTNLEDFISTLQLALRDYGYQSKVVRLSELLDDTPGGGPDAFPKQEAGVAYFDERMRAGDNVRERFQSGDALAAYAICKIRATRFEKTDANSQDHRFAWVLRTLKHPAEVELLRVAYGRRFVLLGVSAPESERIEHLKSLTGANTTSGVQTLVERDEQDDRNEFGQHVRGAFSLSDAFIELKRGRDSDAAIRRIVGLLFGRPFITPTRAEHAMYHAQAAAFRSAAFGRQVGAALATRSGQIVALGTNEVPAPGGGEYWDGDNPDHRDHALGEDFNKAKTNAVMTEILMSLQKAKWLANQYSAMSGAELVRAALDSDDGSSPLGDTRLRSLIEFGRIAHAEMSAINDAARRGVPTQSLDLYTSTYPCHMCARIILNAGIRKVIYIDPYAKSLVGEMYRDLVSADEDSDHVQFSRFVGIAPSLYPLVFKQVNRDVSANGQRKTFDPTSAWLRLSEGDTLAGAAAVELSIVDALMHRISELSPDVGDDNGGDAGDGSDDEHYVAKWLTDTFERARAELEGTARENRPFWLHTDSVCPNTSEAADDASEASSIGAEE